MHRPHLHQPNFIEAFLGLVLRPGEMTATLFSQRRPPFVFSFFFVAFLSLLGPIVFQSYKYGFGLFNSTALASISIIGTFTVLCFILIESVVLGILGLGFSPLKVAACIGYSTAPLVGAVWLTYIFNYISHGRLTIITLLVTGHAAPQDPILESMPYVFIICQLLMFIVLFSSLRQMGNLGLVDGFLVGTVSLIPLYGSLVLGVILANSVNPGTVQMILKVLNSPELLTRYGGL